LLPEPGKGLIRILGKGERVRELPIHDKLRAALCEWLDERASCPGAGDSAALFLNQRGGDSAPKARTTSSPAAPASTTP